MSMTMTTPDAWKEMCLLLENRKQALDNALVRTLDDKCSASHYQVVRSLMLDQERLLFWFIAQQNSGQERPHLTAPSQITKPASPQLASPVKRAGFLKPGLLVLLAIIFFFVVILMALAQGHFPESLQLQSTSGYLDESTLKQGGMARHLRHHGVDFQEPWKCSEMENNHDPAYQNASLRGENEDAFAPARSAFTHQNRVAACDPSLQESS